MYRYEVVLGFARDEENENLPLAKYNVGVVGIPYCPAEEEFEGALLAATLEGYFPKFIKLFEDCDIGSDIEGKLEELYYREGWIVSYKLI